jgi:hypothetical protein
LLGLLERVELSRAKGKDKRRDTGMDIADKIIAGKIIADEDIVN